MFDENRETDGWLIIGNLLLVAFFGILLTACSDNGDTKRLPPPTVNQPQPQPYPQGGQYPPIQQHPNRPGNPASEPSRPNEPPVSVSDAWQGLRDREAALVEVGYQFVSEDSDRLSTRVSAKNDEQFELSLREKSFETVSVEAKLDALKDYRQYVRNGWQVLSSQSQGQSAQTLESRLSLVHEEIRNLETKLQELPRYDRIQISQANDLEADLSKVGIIFVPSRVRKTLLKIDLAPYDDLYFDRTLTPAQRVVLFVDQVIALNDYLDVSEPLLTSLSNTSEVLLIDESSESYLYSKVKNIYLAQKVKLSLKQQQIGCDDLSFWVKEVKKEPSEDPIGKRELSRAKDICSDLSH